ncbi:hypothetical protein CC2G_002464 [Coprinopsis cinerea AmutBmut pab1-1]|nr:hypothetical protein CC2G_002464 [Coprinopsis cinerea AmutBmut pab1-1]
MNRRHGFEGALGIGGGGIVSAESEASLNKARDLARKGKPKEALPHLLKALDDRNNLDAMVEMAFLCPTVEQTIKMLERAELRGRLMLKERFGPKCFDDDGGQVGNFWDILETRPYMRVLQAQEKVYWETGRYSKSTAVQEELLRLRPGDNLSIRKSLGTALIRNKRYADALSFAQQWIAPDRKRTPPRGGTIYSPPNPKPYTPEEEKGLGQYKKCFCDLMHTAALASFKLYGDCEQSRQYLRVAAASNPHILVKILGKKTRPETVNHNPRAPNGPEDAHDYLWYGQDLWMKPDVWNWVNSREDVKEIILRTCNHVGCSARETEVAQFKRCSACRLVCLHSFSELVRWYEEGIAC